MVHRKMIIATWVAIAFAVGTSAQSPPHHHALESHSIVDGSQRPDLIPDSTMYRLFFLTVSTGPNNTEQERERQAARLTAMKLSGTDRVQVMMVLSDFKTRYKNLVARYNEYATETLKQNAEPDNRIFLQQQEDLVQSTRDALNRVLSVSGKLSFDAYVQNEKKRVQLHTIGGQQ